MKKLGLSVLLGCALHISLEAQPATLAAPPNTNTPSARVAPTIIGRSANERIWARITQETNNGQVTLVTNKAYTEFSSGL